MWSFLLLVSSIGLVTGFLHDGLEYIYTETGIQNAGTMDYSPSGAGISWTSTVRLQVGDDRVNVQVSNILYSEYVGEYPTDHSAWQNTTFTSPAPGHSYEYGINYKDGKIVGIEIPAGLPLNVRNQIRASASHLQASDQLKESAYFESREKLLHGDCNVHYTSNEGMVTRSVSHFTDCANRPFRWVDNWRGWRCDKNWAMESHFFDGKYVDGRKSPEPIYSKSDSYYVIGSRKGQSTVEVMGTEAGIATQFFEAEGASHFIYTKRVLTLQDVKTSDNSIRPSGQTYSDLTFETENPYQWNKDRNLKDNEQFFSAGKIFVDDQSSLQGAVLAVMNEMHSNFDIHDTTEENIERLHKYGVNSALPLMYGMNYESLRSVFNKLRTDSSVAGVIKTNLFVEFLGSTGTTASAILIKDAVNEGLFEDGRSAIRSLASIAFHIRRPNTQLVKEIESIEVSDSDSALAMTLPLTVAHLVRRTCELAGKDMASQEFRQCISEFSDKYADQYFNTLTTSKHEEEKALAISCLYNLRWGKVSKLLKPFIYNKNENDDLLASAVDAAMFSTFLDQSTVEYFLPIFMNKNMGYQTRINALRVFSYGEFDMTHLTTIVNMLYAEQNFEVANFAYSLFEMYSNSLDPCLEDKKDMYKFFLRHIKQVGLHRTDYSIGVSKIYTQEFQKEKFGYGGSNILWVIGSEKSKAPVRVGVGIQSHLYHSYTTNLIEIELRIEGLARAALKKLKKYPENEWKLQDLANMLTGMGLELKPDQPVKVEILVKLKGTVILQRLYDESSTKKGGRISDFLESLQDSTSGNEFAINHQRALTFGIGLYEQPTETGLPMFYASSLTTMVSLQANIKKGLSRGVLFRDINYDIHLKTQGVNILAFMDLKEKKRFEISQDRVYGAHFPRHLIIGVNLLKKELRLQVKRPEKENPLHLLMHGRTSVGITQMSLKGGDSSLSAHCPSCLSKYVISKGNARTKPIVNIINRDLGSMMKGEYFDCELELKDEIFGSQVVNVFSPMNKYPQTPISSFLMGLRQARTFLMYYPKVEKCGAYLRWSQAPTDPVNEIDFSIQVKTDDDGQLYFYEGRKTLIKMSITLKGEPADRVFKFNIKYVHSPGGVKNEVRTQFARQANPALGLSDYSVCFSADNQFPEIPDSQFGNLDDPLKMKANFIVRYGETTSCNEAAGVVIVDSQHETTAEAKEDLKKRHYYQKCMEEKASPTWRQRSALPFTPNCWKAASDSALARKYSWKVKFESISPEIEKLLSKSFSAFTAFMIPFWNNSPGSFNALTNNNPKLNIDVLFKNEDKLVDLTLETDKGKTTYEDISTNSFDVFDGVLSNLRPYDSLGTMLIQMRLLNFCVLTSSNVITLDNVTLPYTPTSCWSLVSSHCATDPTYAVLSQKNPNLPLAMKLYLGGHKLEFTPLSAKAIKITFNDQPLEVNSKDTKTHKEGDEEIFKIVNWSGTYYISNGDVFVIYDGNFIEVLPMPWVGGQHCGVCGNYDGNGKNELTGKQGSPLPVEQLPQAWCK